MLVNMTFVSLFVYLIKSLAEGAGLEPASSFEPQFSRLVPYHSAQPSFQFCILPLNQLFSK